MTHKSWDREPVGDIVLQDNGHVYIDHRCTFCDQHEHDLWDDVCKGGNKEQVDVWTFESKRNDMADYEDERGRFYVDDGQWDIRDYWGDETGPEDRPWL